MNIKTPFLRLRGGVLCYRDICNFAKVHVLSIYHQFQNPPLLLTKPY